MPGNRESRAGIDGEARGKEVKLGFGQERRAAYGVAVRLECLDNATLFV